MVSAESDRPISVPEKMMRIGLASYPVPVDLKHFYPALSLYRVDRVFSLENIEEAADRYVRDNPFFSGFRLIERQFDSIEDFPLPSFQAFINDVYGECSRDFLLASITYVDRPDIQGIFTAFPMPMLDGYRCFLFHQTLMKSLKTGRDEFNIATMLGRLEVDGGALSDCIPEIVDTAPGAREEIRALPFGVGERVVQASKVDKYLDELRERFLKRSCENVIVIKNGLYESSLTIGNFLMFLHVPADVVARSTGHGIRRAEAKSPFSW